MSLQVCLTLLVSAGGACMDLLFERVQNHWIWVSWMAGFFYQVKYYGMMGIPTFCMGITAPIILLFPLFLFRMLGAGDIKLFSALGGIIGVTSILKGIVCSFVIGSVFSVLFLVSCGNYTQRIKYLKQYIKQGIVTRQRVPYRKKGKQMENIHFTVSILLGMLLYAGGYY